MNNLRRWNAVKAYIAGNFQLYRKMRDFHKQIEELNDHLPLTKEEEEQLANWLFADNWPALHDWRNRNKVKIEDAQHSLNLETIRQHKERLRKNERR